MFPLIATIILAVIAVALLLAFLRVRVPNTDRWGEKSDGSHRLRPLGFASGVTGLGAVVFLLLATVYTQSVGQASVLVNAGGTISGQDATPGWGVKAPWQTRSTWDLFSQSATYAGTAEGAPSYTGGDVSGQEITSAVAGGAQTNFDLSVTYNLDGEHVEDLFREFRTQERFVKQVVEPQILAVVRDIPTAYRPVDFRGEKRGEATTLMADALNESLGKWGVTVTLVNLQNITFTDEVEESIKAVEVAQQREAEAEADLRATEVSAQAQVVEAEAQAEANRVLAQSLTPELLQQRWIDAIRESAGTIVVPDSAAPLINVQPAN